MTKLRDVDEVRLVDATIPRDRAAEVRLARHVARRPRQVERIALARGVRAAKESSVVEIGRLERAAKRIPDGRGGRRAARHDVDEVVAISHFVVQRIKETITLNGPTQIRADLHP